MGVSIIKATLTKDTLAYLHLVHAAGVQKKPRPKLSNESQRLKLEYSFFFNCRTITEVYVNKTYY